jgi:large subunit ribosomal protein L29
MKMKDLRELTRDELMNRHDQLLSDLFGMRIKHALGQLENPLQLRSTRRQIAQLKTLLRRQGVKEVTRRRSIQSRAAAPKSAGRAKSAAVSGRAEAAGAEKK